jgi:hypothetical protein
MAPIDGSHTPSPLTLTATAGPGKSSSMQKHETFDAPVMASVTSGSLGISLT